MNNSMYKKEEVKEKTLEYFNGDELATNVWMDKYALKDKEDVFLESSPIDMHHRLIKNLLKEEKKYKSSISLKEIMNLLYNFKHFIPGGSSLFGIGNPVFSSLGNCFVIGNGADSYGGICTIDEEQVQIMKRRGGVGHDLSHIRPKGSPTSNAAKTSTGIIPFMERFSNSTKEVAQDGRRGALMLTLDVNHPDIEDFITAKDDLTKITGANISVKIDDNFMTDIAIAEGLPESTKNTKNVKTWNKLIYQAWKTAEPGVLFWDKIISESPADCYGDDWKSTSSNPCGELILCPYDSCRLGSLNLYSFVINPFTDKAYFSFVLFKEKIKHAVRMMDDIIDLEEKKIKSIIDKISKDPEDVLIKLTEIKLWYKILNKLKEGRRTGLGVLGLADMLAALNVDYAMPETEPFVEEVFKYLARTTYKTSIELAKERGAFPIYDYKKEKDNPFINRIMKDNPNLEADYKKYGRRNIASLTVAPTGTVSIMSQVSSGIEPVFDIFYTRRRKVTKETDKSYFDEEGILWEDSTVIHKPFKDWLKIKHENVDINILSEDDLNKFIKESPYCENTAIEINPLYKVAMQGIIQKYIDHSISTTYNLPEKTTKEEVSALYMAAWKAGCKGITIYRENSRQGILVSNTSNFTPKDATKRPSEIKCDIHRTTIKGEKWIILIGLLNNHPYEVFGLKQEDISIPNKIENGILRKNKIKTKTEYLLLSNDKEVLIEDIVSNFRRPSEEWSTRLISGMLRHHADPKFIYEQLYKAPGHINDYAKCIARTLKKYLDIVDVISVSKCSNCNSKNLSHQDGCLICLDCGNSSCG